MTASASGPGAEASGWAGATANTIPTSAIRRVRHPPPDGGSPGAPTARSARPPATASQVPPSTSRVSRRRVCGAPSAVQCASNAATSGQMRERGTIVSTATVSSDSHPVATRRTRRASASASSQEKPAGGDELAPRGRQPRAVPAPVEQQHVERLLEAAHRVGDRGRDAPELVGGRGEASAAVDRVEHGQRIERGQHIQKY